MHEHWGESLPHPNDNANLIAGLWRDSTNVWWPFLSKHPGYVSSQTVSVCHVAGSCCTCSPDQRMKAFPQVQVLPLLIDLAGSSDSREAVAALVGLQCQIRGSPADQVTPSADVLMCNPSLGNSEQHVWV